MLLLLLLFQVRREILSVRALSHPSEFSLEMIERMIMMKNRKKMLTAPSK